MNKKAQWAEIQDVFLGGLIISLAFLTFMGYIQLRKYNVESTFEEKVQELDNDFLIPLLSYEFEDGTILTNVIINAHVTEETDELNEKMDYLLQEIYTVNMCWALYREGFDETFFNSDKMWVGSSSCKKKEHIINSDVILPLPDKETLKLKLVVEGYAE